MLFGGEMLRVRGWLALMMPPCGGFWCEFGIGCSATPFALLPGRGGGIIGAGLTRAGNAGLVFVDSATEAEACLPRGDLFLGGAGGVGLRFGSGLRGFEKEAMRSSRLLALVSIFSLLGDSPLYGAGGRGRVATGEPLGEPLGGAGGTERRDT